MHSSSFQHSMHDHTCQYYMGKQRISIVPACIKSIPHMPLLDDHSTCITRKYVKALEAVDQTNDKNMSTITLSTTKPAAPTQLLSGLEAELNDLNSIYTSYQSLIQAATQLLNREPSFNRIPVSGKCMKRSLLPFLGGCIQLVNWHSHNKGHQCYHNKDQPVDFHSTEPRGDPCSHHINT